MHVDIGAAAVFDEAAVREAGTLVRLDLRMGMNTAMNAVEIVNAVPEALGHDLQEPPSAVASLPPSIFVIRQFSMVSRTGSLK